MSTAKTLATLALSVAFATTFSAQARSQCLSDAQVAEMAGHYFAKTPVPNLPNPPDADAACTRTQFQARLGERLGKAVGY